MRDKESFVPGMLGEGGGNRVVAAYSKLLSTVSIREAEETRNDSLLFEYLQNKR
jgi:hypothetical protein